MSKIFARFLKDESGATAIEYGLIAALISVALIAGASQLGGALDDQFGRIADIVADPDAAAAGGGAGGGGDAGNGG